MNLSSETLVTDLQEDQLDEVLHMLTDFYAELPVPQVRKIIKGVLFARTVTLPERQRAPISNAVESLLAEADRRRDERLKEVVARCALSASPTKDG